MKKILSLAMLLVFSFAVYAQKDVTKFLGIPVDGKKSEMIKKLKEKGFTESMLGDDVLEGEFNGVDVYISVVTNNNKVYRIYVADANTLNEADIIIRYNNLCYQFQHNKKYMPTLIDLHSIPTKENIAYEMSVNNKRYETAFYQMPDSALITQKVYSEYSKKQLDNLTEELRKEINDKTASYIIDTMFKKCVWFMIAERLGGYYIAMFYDNKYNQAQGEDL